MTQVEEYSPLHEESMRIKYEQLGKTPSDYRLTRKSHHYFAADPSQDAQIVRIVIKDRFGHEWNEEINIKLTK
jgi:hypothetical protein